MNHRFKLHPDGTLEITMPKGKKVSRVLVCEAGTQNGTLMYPDCDDCHIKGMINGNYCPNCGCQMNGGKQDERFKHSRTMHT